MLPWQHCEPAKEFAFLATGIKLNLPYEQFVVPA